MAHAQPRVLESSLPYIVRSQDNLSKLGREMLVKPQAWSEVAKYNQLTDADALVPGQKIDIPLRLLKSKAAGGKVIIAEGDVSLGDVPVQPGALVADGSQIKTGANSSAVIELGDGSRIKVLPNSLALVVTNRNYQMRDAGSSGSTTWFSGLMRLTSGTIEALASKTAKRATPLQIQTPTSTVGIRGTEFRVAFDDPSNNAARTEVLEGRVRADNPAQGNGADLPMGTGAVVKPQDKEVKVVPLLPAPDLAAIPQEIIKPQGLWPMPVLAGADGYRVQVASDEKFDKILRDIKVSGVPGANAELGSLANGDWFARVRGIDPAGLEGFDTVKVITVKELQWRATHSVLSVVGGKTTLRWYAQKTNFQQLSAENFSAVLAKDAALAQSAITLQSTGPMTELILGDIKPGVYYIRLRGKLAQGISLDSEVYRLEVPAGWGQGAAKLDSVLQVPN